jgi:signal transduction histidine kinase
MQKKLRKLTHQVISAQEEERKRISRDLHDEVVQTLVGINVALATLGTATDPRKLKTSIGRTRRLVEASIETVHRFARELRPAVLDDLGLIPALHSYCQSLSERKKLIIRITAFGGVETLPNSKRTALFRVAQEALTNIARHAKATLVEIAIQPIAGGIRMEIHYDGKSFPAAASALDKTAPKRLGLIGMNERIRMIGGRLTLESSPGKGTTVRAEIPLTPKVTKP